MFSFDSVVSSAKFGTLLSNLKVVPKLVLDITFLSLHIDLINLQLFRMIVPDLLEYSVPSNLIHTLETKYLKSVHYIQVNMINLNRTLV